MLIKKKIRKTLQIQVNLLAESILKTILDGKFSDQEPIIPLYLVEKNNTIGPSKVSS
jgi:hypothetical protein